jgi:hypothetical protein
MVSSARKQRQEVLPRSFVISVNGERRSCPSMGDACKSRCSVARYFRCSMSSLGVADKPISDLRKLIAVLCFGRVSFRREFLEINAIARPRPSKLAFGPYPLFGPPHRGPKPSKYGHSRARRPGPKTGQRIWPKNGVFGQPKLDPPSRMLSKHPRKTRVFERYNLAVVWCHLSPKNWCR